MITAILVVIFYTNGSGMAKSVAFQEFNNMQQCEYARTVILKRASLNDAFCLHK
jgi:hypothetical protein